VNGGEILEKETYEKLITDAAKTIFSYCRARTNSKEDAEDLSQDIILKLLRKQENLRDDKAFYGFMWAVADNVYKQWYKKRKKIIENGLDENIPDDSVPLVEMLEKESDLKLLYRELNLLTEQYRKVIVLYYFNDNKVSDISKSLNISESMVKFLLFKSRKILKEGMNMERTRGNLSFNPGKLSLSVLGGGPDSKLEDRNALYPLVNDSLIAQNILLTCYNDRCTAEEISLQIGVAVPYLEKDLKKLCEKELLIQKGGKYETNILIFTKEFLEEEYEKTLPAQHELAGIVEKCLNERMNDIKAIGFHTGVDNDNLMKWLVTSAVFIEARWKDIEYFENNTPAIPKTYAGTRAFVWAVEQGGPQSGFGNIAYGNTDGDIFYCADFPETGAAERSGPYFGHQNRVNIMLDIAKGKTGGFSENDMFEIAEFIKRGYVRKTEDKLISLIPVFTKEQFFNQFLNLVDDVLKAISDKARSIANNATDILVQHTPVSLKKYAENFKGIKARDCIGIAVKIMMDNGILQQVAENAHPATYIMLA
jgi:RNA polymerase sigma factor (sigma-70 family)